MRQISVLVIDDEDDFREECSQELALRNLRTVAVKNREDALEVLKAPDQAIDIVLLDIMLPGDYGVNVLGAILELSSAPVIMITRACADQSLEQTCLQQGAVHLERKPLNYGLLATRIDAIIRILTRGEPRHFEFSGWKLDKLQRELTNPDGVAVDLSASEWDILCELLQNQGICIPRWQLEGLLRAPDRLNRHISSLRTKFGDNSHSPWLIKTVHNHGYQIVAGVTTR